MKKITKRKYKGFSLIEAMILFTALALILLAFLPVMLKRSQKTMEADCVGGLRSVRMEYQASDIPYTFSVPEKIASTIIVTLVGGGAGGQNGVSSPMQQNGTSCELSIPSKSDVKFYRNISVSAVQKGSNASCDETLRSGQSGYSFSNLRFVMSKTGYGGAIYSNPNDSDWKKLLYGDASINELDNHASIESLPHYLNEYQDRSLLIGQQPGDTCSSGTPTSCYGGVPAVHMNTSGNELAGVGGSCIWNSETGSYNTIPPTTGVCKISYEEVTQGRGGGAGAYLKFALVPSFKSCTITVGKGGTGANEEDDSRRNGGDTRLTCDGTAIYMAGGAQGNTNGSRTLPDGNQYIMRSVDGSSSLSGMRDNIYGGYGSGILITDCVSDNNCDNFLFFGLNTEPEGGCYGAKNSFQCINPNGAPGMLGSGGGGGSCNETGCGAGGRGGDGVVIIEYKEYCK